MNYKHTLLSAAIVASLAFTAQVHAQETAPPTQTTDDAKELETVTVIGIRGSVEKSLDVKRSADTRVEVITSEDIGKMPDKNVADALSRVPGVNISAASANEGAFDENDRVSMRGTSPSFTQTLVNGHNIASGDWFVLNQTGTVGRSVSYSLLPSELVDQVIVRKSSEAKLVEGGATGSIDIITRRPLNFAEEVTLQASVGAVYSDLPGDTEPQLSALGNFKNDAGTFGITVQGFSEKRSLRRDGQEILGYDTIKPTDAAGVANPDLVGVFYPVLIGSALFEQKRERTGGLITAQFKPSDSFNFALTGFSSKMKADNYNRNYLLWGSRIIGSGGVPNPGYVVRDNTLVEAQFAADPTRQFGIYDQISRPGASSSSNFFTVEGEWNFSDKLVFKGQAGTSEGHGKSPTQDVAEWDVGLGTGAGWRLNGVGAADWNLGTTNTAAPGAPVTDIKLDFIFGFQDIDVEDKEDWLKLDGQYFVDDSVLSSIEFGVRGARHERNLPQVTAQGPDFSGNGPDPFDPANWPQGFQNYPGDFGSGLGGSFPRDIWFFSEQQLAEFNRLTNRDPVTRFFFPGVYGLEERSSAAYTQFNFQGERWSANAGVRFVRTEEKVTNFVNASATDPDAITTSAFGPFKALVTENTYNDLLPSANLKYEVSDELLLRFAASRTLTRPDYSALSGAVSLSPPAVVGGVGTGTGGNPDLEPILSTNLDATVEWYYAPRALLSAGVFYMDIENYVALGQVTKSFFTIDSVQPAGGAFVDYVLSVPVGKDAKVKGLELAWEQPFGDNFGVFANYTFADGETSDDTDLLGTSKNTYNVGGYFENDRFNARINYTHRSSFFSGLDRASAFYQDEVGSLAASVGYRINDNFSLTLDGLNLNNPKTKYFAQSRERPRSIYENGRQYYLNLRVKF
jgi:iron complex outermembrane receptor protein